jgi:predicted transcriptional regulator
MADPNNPIADVMSRGAISVDEKLTLRSLAAVLAKLDIGVAVVTRPGRSVGVVSERDIVHALADGADPDEVWTADVASDDIVFAELDDTIVDVADRMTIEAVRHITIVDRDAIIGVVSSRDILPALTDYARATL